MIKIGLLSDTHGYINPRVFDFFSSCDELWHAGDIGTEEVLLELEQFKPLRAVSGNIDSARIKTMVPNQQLFTVEKVKVFMTHIGGYPGRYASGIKRILQREKPQLFICGHSHITKIIHDPVLNVLHMNPGAAGNHGLHQLITFIRFDINQSSIENLEIMEIDRKKLISANDQPNESV
ncbi:MAG: metallophosphatase family protein [Bacteroidetes bacterium]|jgi:putative phosphoesterase|nr:metallophosphatase family protein [Bacteroidota bacterium]MBU1579293.1 metallophosphatase family protein [Bacteroidota bacterium]MBU2466701.1 metallophosphatase family protein [Bacteroidota bacterium]MBU2556477.1 metallophosphatase family protein [Bacteroidota bacterium]MDA3943899.1 metallophosphoesterase family protein [Bacteroidota bacterium]